MPFLRAAHASLEISTFALRVVGTGGFVVVREALAATVYSCPFPLIEGDHPNPHAPTSASSKPGPIEPFEPAVLSWSNPALFPADRTSPQRDGNRRLPCVLLISFSLMRSSRRSHAACFRTPFTFGRHGHSLAPSGNSPCSNQRHKAMSSLRAKATMPTFRAR